MAAIFNRRKSKRQIWIALIITTVVGCAALVYASLRYGGHHNAETWKKFTATQEKFTEEKCISVCGSEECVQETNLLLNQVNPSVDPCENFFEFACGKYLEKFAKNESNILQTRMKEQMMLKIKYILENMKLDRNTASQKLKIVYDSCIKRSSSDMKAILATTLILSELGIPNWPNLSYSFKFDKTSLPAVLSNFIAVKEYGFLDISTKSIYYREMPCAEANASIEVEKGTYESKETPVRKYLVEQVLQYFSLDDENIARIWNESEAILSAVVQLKQESERIVTENDAFQMTFIDCTLERENEWEPVCEMLKSFVDAVGVNTGISNKFLNLAATNVYFVQNIFPVLNNFSDRSIANFLTLNVLLSHLDDLSFYFRRLFRKDPASFIAHIGVYVDIDHWQHCTEWVMQKLFIPLGHEYLKSFLTKSVLDELDDLIREIILKTAGEISHQNWITDALRKDMTMKTEYLEPSVTLVKDVLTNDTFINELFNQFHPKDESFMYNVFEYQRYSKLEEMQGTLQAMHLDWFDSSLLMPDASSGGGTIDLQFGLLMPPIYHPNIERIINTVTLSTIVAHEIGHVFQGFNYRLQRQDEKAKNFTDDVRSCINHQYSKFKFKFTGKSVDGKKYERENFPDLIAISIIDKFIEKHSAESEPFLLPAFPYLTEKMLYISSVQMFCTANTQRDEEINDQKASHSLPKFRVLGMMQNSKGFAKAFSCPEGSYMNPSKKCSYFLDK